MFLSGVIVEVLVEELSKLSDQIVLYCFLFLLILLILTIVIRTVKRLLRKIFKDF